MFKFKHRPNVDSTVLFTEIKKSQISKKLITPLLSIIALTTHFQVNSTTFNEPNFSVDYNYNYKEFNNIETEVKTLTSNVFGDSIDVGTGSLSFKQTDVSLPGNFQLPVEITRSLGTPDNWFNAPLQVGNWSIDIPHVRSTYVSRTDGTHDDAYWPRGDACSVALNSNPTFEKTGGSSDWTIEYSLHKDDYWNGDTVYIPNKGSTKLLTKQGDPSFTRYNNKQWKVDCLEDANGKDYFQITTLDGTIYTMKEQRVVTDYQKVSMMPPANHGCMTSPGECQPDSLNPDSGSEEFTLLKHYIFLLVTQVEDKYGNTVIYHYEQNSNGKLTSIVASDLRTINLYYNGNGNLSSVVANGRTWEYKYGEASFGITPLKTVTLPDKRQWLYSKTDNTDGTSNDLTNTFWRELFPPSISNSDLCIAALNDNKFIEITHPEGLVGEFYLAAHCHGQTEVPKIPKSKNNGSNEDTHWIRKENRVIGISEKKLTLTNGQQYIWQYDYSTNPGLWENETAGSAHQVSVPVTGVTGEHLKSTTVTQPNGDYQVHYFDRRYGRSQGNELYVASYQASNKLLKLESKTYDYSDEDPTNPSSYGYNHTKMNMYSDESFEVQYKSYNDEQLTRLVGQTTRIYETNSSNGSNSSNSSLYSQQVTKFNIWNNVLSFTSSNDFLNNNGKTRYVEFEYVDDVAHHAYNLPGKTYVSGNAITKANSELAFETTYIPMNATNSSSVKDVLVVDEQRRFGKWRKKHVDYFDDGNLAKVEYNATLDDGSANRYVRFANYHRGQPKNIEIPARYTSGKLSAIREIDDNGWVTSFTDFAKNLTEYEYDSMGRISAVAPKNGLEAGTLFSWSNNGAPVRTESRCMLNSANTACDTASALLQTVTEYDSMLRPTKVSTTDVSNNYTVKQSFSHDHANQKTFESFKYTGASETNGITTTYDGLGRPSTVSTSFGGTLTTEYLTNNRTKVTKQYNDSTSYDTTTQYLAFGTPSNKHAIEIVSQVGNGKADVITEIAMNVYEEIERITQYDSDIPEADRIVEHRIYDANHNLCKINRPDVGMTAFEYSEGGELLWQAQDFTSTNNTSCEANVSDNIKINFSYDNLGDKHRVTYPVGDSTPDLVHEYDIFGNLTKLTAGNVVQDYGYDKRGLLETETLNVEGEKFTLGYTYNSLNHLASITYPDADVGKVEFAPNAFGLATKAKSTAKTYASEAQYHPNDSIKQFKYGNNLYHFVGLNSRQLPATLAYCTSSDGINCNSSIISYTYGYDYQNNITSITDNVSSAYSINTLDYDGLERLISTSGGASMGSSQLDYDALGNIKSFSSLGSDLDYTYDASNRLSSVVDSVGNNDYTDIDYDNRGNIIKRVKNNTTDDFTYNLANQMIKANNTDYLYDGHNRRVAVTKNGRRTYSFYNQQGQLVYRKTPAGGVSYIFMGNKLVAKDGNVSESGASGKTHYKPFGDTLSPAKDDVGYTGHKFDADLQLSYMQARYYDPVIGRFYGNDPVDSYGHLQRKNPVHGFSRYTYANSNPYKFKDPDGEFAWLAVPIVVGFVAGAAKNIAMQAMSDKPFDGMSALGAGLDGAATGAVMAIGGGTVAALKLGKTMLDLNRAAIGAKALKASTAATTGGIAVGVAHGAVNNYLNDNSSQSAEQNNNAGASNSANETETDQSNKAETDK